MKMRTWLMCGAVLFAASVSRGAFSPLPLGTLKQLMKEDVFLAQGGDLKYRIYAPPELSSVTNKVPLVLFLHGSGECGTNNWSQLVHGVGGLVGWCRHSKTPAVVLAPQAPPRSVWSPVFFTEATAKMPRRTPPLIAALDGLLDETIERYPVDPKRVMVTGISLGGYATWDLVERYPGRFAGALPVCGAGDPARTAEAAKTPLWIFHGERDPNVPNRFDRKMVSRLWDLDAPVRYQEYPDCGHGIWGAVYGDEKVMKWLFTRAK